MTNAAAMITENVARTDTVVPPPIAYIVSRFPRLTETFILREIIELQRRGQPVLVFPLLSVQQRVRHTENSMLAGRIHYTPYLSREVLAANLEYIMRSPGRYLKTFFRVFWGNRGSLYLWSRGLALFPKSVCIARRIAVSGARHIHAHFATHPALAAMIASDLTGMGFSFTAHAHDIFVHRCMLREKIQRARFVVTISEFNRRYLLRIARGIPEEKIHVVRCGVAPEQYGRRPLRNHTDRAIPHILCVASLEPYKGIEYLIRACARLRRSVPEFQCSIIGEGRDRTRLSTLIRELQLEREVHLLGPQMQDEVAERLSRADLFVLPSVVAQDGQMEGIPVALMEAMASGIPVIATQISGIPELIDHGHSGLLVPPGDESALAEALSVLCLRQDLRDQFGLRGREKVSAGFQLRKNVASLDSLFRAASSGNSAFQRKSNNVSPELVAGIRQILLRGSSGHATDEMQIAIEALHPGAGGHDSSVFVVRVHGFYPGLILKQHRPRQKPENAGQCARREYEILLHLAQQLPRLSPHFGVPEVLAFFPEFNALLISECPGENLGRQLRWAQFRRGSFGTAAILRGAAASGEWLGTFHEATLRHEAADSKIRYDIESFFESDLQTCARLGLDERLALQVSGRFAREFPVALAADLQWTGHHGDFGPHNVFLSPERTLVIDFEGFRIGHPVEDVADFLVLVDLLPSYHAGASLRRGIREAFLAGYTGRRPLKLDLIKIFELQALVKRMAHNPQLDPSHSAQFGSRRERLLRSYRRHFEVLL
ncbi:MAG: glycosyltransferase [Acidobacteria bacterium]|nr:glycosyltransferase [Acidobacteriota bacterium]